MFWSLWLVLVTLVGIGVHWMSEGRLWLGGITCYVAVSWMLGLLMASVFKYQRRVPGRPLPSPSTAPEPTFDAQPAPGWAVPGSAVSGQVASEQAAGRPRRSARAAWRAWAARDVAINEPALRPRWVRVAAREAHAVARD